MDGFKQLSNLLCSTIETHNKLLELENRKKDILINGDISELDEILKLEQPLLMNAAGLEKKRSDLQQEMNLGDITLRQIIDLYDLQNKYLLQTRFDELSEVIAKLKKANRINIEILNSRVSMLNQFISLIGQKETALTYEKDGHVLDSL
jgi:flagellar biosynthesis/type III secretory pathway chaperone